jgi:polyhydroxybutyrate depolymerase
VSLCIVEGGGHAWPGQTPMRWQNMTKTYVTQSFDATREVWQFFEKHPKR